MKSAIGGTFSPLHAGHTYLLKKALKLSEEVIIGLTSDKMVNKDVRKYKYRKKTLKKFLKKQEIETSYKVIKINNKYGPVTKKDFDAIIVSPETKKTATKINKKRKKNNLSPLKIIVCNYILAEDWQPISSTRIREGEINNKGKIIKN